MIIKLTHLKKVATLPSGQQMQLIWARKLFPDKNFYEISLKELTADGYTCWYVELVGMEFKWISCSLQLTPETQAIKLALSLEGKE